MVQLIALAKVYSASSYRISQGGRPKLSKAVTKHYIFVIKSGVIKPRSQFQTVDDWLPKGSGQ